MDHSTIRYIKSLAKRLKKENSILSYCQCLDLVAQQSYGARHFHELQKTAQQTASSSKKLTASNISSMPTYLRYNDWPYFDIPPFYQQLS